MTKKIFALLECWRQECLHHKPAAHQKSHPDDFGAGLACRKRSNTDSTAAGSCMHRARQTRQGRRLSAQRQHLEHREDSSRHLIIANSCLQYYGLVSKSQHSPCFTNEQLNHNDTTPDRARLSDEPYVLQVLHDCSVASHTSSST